METKTVTDPSIMKSHLSEIRIWILSLQERITSRKQFHAFHLNPLGLLLQQGHRSLPREDFQHTRSRFSRLIPLWYTNSKVEIELRGNKGWVESAIMKILLSLVLTPRQIQGRTGPEPSQYSYAPQLSSQIRCPKPPCKRAAKN